MNQIEDMLEDFDFTAGIDVNIDFAAPIRKHAFVWKDKTEELIKEGDKIRVYIVFPDPQSAILGGQLLRAAKCQDFPWNVFLSVLPQEIVFVETEWTSLFAHWLCNVNIDIVM